jgi:hypothetical protein
MTAEDPEDSGSTLVRTGKSALTFKEMGAFVRDLETRPAPRLLADLPGLMALPEAKYSLVVMVLRRKTRPDAPERTTLLEHLGLLQSSSDDPLVRQRSKAFLERPD